jgi:hypothetical protein
MVGIRTYQILTNCDVLRPLPRTVTTVACGRGSCNHVGRFVSADGSDVRTGVEISGGSSLGVGRSLPAIDSGGAKVYPPGGGHDWWAYPSAAALLAALCALWIWTFPVAVIRRRRAARRPPLGRT